MSDRGPRYRGHLKVLDGSGPATDLDTWVARWGDALLELSRRAAEAAVHMSGEGVSDAAAAVAVAGQAAQAAATILRRSVPSGPPIRSSAG